MPLEIAQALTESRLTDLRRLLAPLLQTRLPLTLEVGSGHGHYLTAYAQTHHVDVEIVDHPHVDDSLARIQAIAGHTTSTGPSMFVAGDKGFLNFLGMLSECYQANIAKLEASPPPPAARGARPGA